jgi:hypothetical protein
MDQYNKHFTFDNKKESHSIFSYFPIKIQSNRRLELTQQKTTHPFKNLTIIFLVKRFIEKLKALYQRRRFFNLSEYQLKLINDSTYDGENIKNYSIDNNRVGLNKPYQSRTILLIFQDKFKKFKNINYYIKDGFLIVLENIKTFSPEYNTRIIWDFNLLFFLVLNIFYVPLTLGFEFDSYEEISLFSVINFFYFSCNIFPMAIFLIDILVNMNTAYYSKGEYVIQKKKIIKNYINNYLFFDFLSVLPFIVKFFLFYNNSMFEIFFFFRLIKLRKLILKMDAYLRLESKPQGIFNLCKLLFLIIFIAHICGCCWNSLALIEKRSDIIDNWHFRYLNYNN